MDKIFISYAKEDRIEAKRIYSFLNKNSAFQPWLDVEFLLPGMHWENEIMQVIDECKLIVLVLSQNSISKTGFVQKEVKLALDNIDYLPSNSIYIIPIKVSECVINEPRLKKIQYVELFKDWDSGMNKIMKTLEIVRKDYTNTKKSKVTTLNISNKNEGDYKLLNKEDVLNILNSTRDFSTKNCMNIDFHNMDLSGCNFRAANLIATNFRNSNLKYSNFTCANLERADLSKANIEMTNLWGANFWRANLTNIKNFHKVLCFENTNFYGTIGIESFKDFLMDKDTIQSPDYIDFSLHFKNTLKISTKEYRDLYSWMKHQYFVNMFKPK